MKATSKETTSTNDRRKADRRTASERRIDVARAIEGDRRIVENRGECEAMVDALEDILRWEKTSERSLKVAAKVVAAGKPSN